MTHSRLSLIMAVFPNVQNPDQSIESVYSTSPCHQSRQCDSHLVTDVLEDE